MNVERYLEKRREREAAAPRYRETCVTCLQPSFGCFCRDVVSFDPGVRFVILTHPIELKRRIATGRMSHLCLRNSLFLVGHDYTGDARVNALIADPGNHCVILYPGRNSFDLSARSREEREGHFPKDKTLVMFVIDGTWATARQTARLSRNLMELPRVCFTPSKPSNFRVRKQPAPQCYSTIEAIHHVLDLLNFQPQTRPHDVLLKTFEGMVERQLKFVMKSPPRLRIHAMKKKRMSAAGNTGETATGQGQNS